jgi:N-acyl-D-aspartate/D-glutamate deacylase
MVMLDVRINGGLVIDGTGSAGRHADVGIRDGRVVAIGIIDEAANRTVDATGLIVAPGFVDVHTHYDAQAFWDTTLSPSPLHGVTTVIGGNCGFTIAPLTPDDGDYLMRMLSRVEGMPLEALQVGVPWDWRTTGEYLDRLDGTLMPNAGFLVGHSALRRVVMHDEATERHATSAEIEQMKELLRDGLRDGGLGFSSTWSTSHNDHHGNPVPSRVGSREEILALCSVVGEFPGTTLEFIPQVGKMTEESFDLMAAMSAAANRPINWNFIQVYGINREHVDHQLSGFDYAADRGGKVIGLTLPDSFRMRLNFASGFVLDILNGWDKLMALPKADKLAMMRDPAGREQMNALAQSTEGNIRSVANWRSYTLIETFTDEHKRFVGRTFGDIALELGKTPWDTLCDIVVDDELRTSFSNHDPGQDDASWERRVEVWRDHRSLVGASDAGAHLDMIDSFAMHTQMLGKAVRERGLLPWEEAIHMITQAPAELYGLRDRGVLKVGSFADITVIDPTTVGQDVLHTRFDLPTGAARLFAEANGIEHVFVNGTEVVTGKQFTDARPGTLLRSGRDTDTVTAR